MATLRSVFVLALILVSLPALYAASSPKRGDDAAGSAAVDAARWGRTLLEASSGSAASDADVDQVGSAEEEEEVGDQATDGLDEAVRVLIGADAWKSVVENMRQAKKWRAAAEAKAGGKAKNGGVDGVKGAASAHSSGKGRKGAAAKMNWKKIQEEARNAVVSKAGGLAKKGGIAAGGSAGVGAASWGRKLLEASSGAAASGADADLNQLDVHVGGEEEEVGEVTDGLDEAVRVLLSWKKIKNAAKNAASKAGGVAKKVVQKGGVEALKAAAKGYSNGGMKGALKAGGTSFASTAKKMAVRPHHTPPSPLPRSAAASPAPTTPSSAGPSPLCPCTSLPPPSTPLLTLDAAEARPEPWAVRGGAAAEAEVAGGFRKGGAEEGRAPANGGACDGGGAGGRG
ncbi:unnamed protein product [Closterium sp. Naga37s-1]|nr:unnamed protein product [Closterium sp. Naga37s-1]